MAIDAMTLHDAAVTMSLNCCVRSWHCHGPAQGLEWACFGLTRSPNAFHGTAVGFHRLSRNYHEIAMDCYDNAAAALQWP